MKISEPEQSKLAASISMAKLPASSTTGDASGYGQSADWLRVGAWSFPKDRIAIIGEYLGDIKIWLDTGLTLEMSLRENVDIRTAQRAILNEPDATKFIRTVVVGRS